MAISASNKGLGPLSRWRGVQSAHSAYAKRVHMTGKGNHAVAQLIATGDGRYSGDDVGCVNVCFVA
jgi:hypothetical protein